MSTCRPDENGPDGYEGYNDPVNAATEVSIMKGAWRTHPILIPSRQKIIGKVRTVEAGSVSYLRRLKKRVKCDEYVY